MPRRRIAWRKRRLLDASETCAALGISLRRLNSLMHNGMSHDVVMYGCKPYFRSIEARSVARSLNRRLLREK